MRQIKVLVGDKDDHLREKIAGILSRFENILMVTQTGREDDLLRIVEETNTDVVLVDAGMAAQGRKTISAISKIRSGIKIFLMAYDRNPSYDSLVDSLGAVGVIQKDAIISELKKARILFFEEEEAAEEREAGPCVLLADDDAFYRNRMAELLKKSHIRYKAVSSGEQAYMEIVSAPESYCCIVLDVYMKNLDGLAAGRMIRDIVREMPIIYVTSDDSEITIREAKSMDCKVVIKNAFFEKSFLDSVKNRISEVA